MRLFTTSILPLKTPLEVFLNQVNNNPDKLAVVKDNTSLTYRKFYEYIQFVALQFIKSGIKPGDVVTVLLPNSIESVGIFFASMLLGAIYAPIDMQQPQERIETIIINLKAKLIITKENKVKIFHDPTLLNVKEMENSFYNYPKEIIVQQDIAYIIHTSGSTGIPKAVACRHEGLLNLLKTIDNIAPISIHLSGTVWTQFSFDVSIYEICHILYKGGTLHILTEDIRFDSTNYFGYLEKYNITSAYIPPFLLPPFLRFLQNYKPCLSLQRLLVGVESIAEDLIYSIQELIPNTIILNGYGPTETTICATIYRVPPRNSLKNLHTKIPIGKPIENTECHVLNKKLIPVKKNETGELFISGKALAAGYWLQPELAKTSFINIDNICEEKVYRTGDLVKWNEDGNLEFIGRTDDQIKIRGYRIEPMEIQIELGKIPYIKQAAVTVIEDPNTMGKALFAFVVLTEGVGGDENSIKAVLSNKLPSYMVPDQIIIIDNIPITSHGKTDFVQLQEFIRQESNIKDTSLNIDDQMTQIMIDIWQALLNKKVNISDNFFNIGGDSILAMQMVSYLKEKGILVELRQVFAHPTIAELSQIINSPLLKNENIKFQEYSLTPIQLWFFEQKYPMPNEVTQSMLLELNISPDIDKLKNAFTNLLAEYTVLRMSFQQNKNRVWHAYDLPIESEDIKKNIKVSVVDSFKQVKEIYNSSKQDINYERGHLIKLHIIQDAASNKFYLFLIAHHLVIDIVSWTIIYRELFRYYLENPYTTHAFHSKRNLSFAQWANKLREFSSEKVFADELTFWQEQDAKKSLIMTNFKKDIFSVQSKKIIFNNLSNSPESTMVLYEKIVTIVISSLAKSFNTSLVKIMLESHGRYVPDLNSELSESIGWFTNMYPLAFAVELHKPFQVLLQQTKQLMDKVKNSGLGYGYLRYIRRVGNLGKNEANVLLNYLGRLDNQFIYKNISADIVPTDNEFNIDINQLRFPLEIICYQQNNDTIFKILYAENLISGHIINDLSDSISHFCRLQNSTIQQNFKTPKLVDDNVILMREGNSEIIFLIHPIGGEIYWYYPLISHLSEEYIIYGVKCPDLVNQNISRITLEDLAEHYVNQILPKVESQCSILGWSFGAVLAFEIIKRLKHHGINILKFYCIDQPLLDLNIESNLDQYSLVINEEKFQINLKELLYETAESYFQKYSSNIDFIVEHKNHLLTQLILLQALVSYKPQGIISHAHLILSATTERLHKNNSFYGWKRYVKLNPDITIIPGDHHSILQPKDVINLTGLINKDLQKNYNIRDTLL